MAKHSKMSLYLMIITMETCISTRDLMNMQKNNHILHRLCRNKHGLVNIFHPISAESLY